MPLLALAGEAELPLELEVAELLGGDEIARVGAGGEGEFAGLEGPALGGEVLLLVGAEMGGAVEEDPALGFFDGREGGLGGGLSGAEDDGGEGGKGSEVGEVHGGSLRGTGLVRSR